VPTPATARGNLSSGFLLNIVEVGMSWRLPVAVILGPVCFFTAFVAEGVKNEVAAISTIACAVGVSFFLAQYLLSRGQTSRDALRIMAALNSLPLCMGILVVVLERSTGAWIQGVLVVAVALACSLAGAALAGRTALKSAQLGPAAR
jgi:hypothetical protein